MMAHIKALGVFLAVFAFIAIVLIFPNEFMVMSVFILAGAVLYMLYAFYIILVEEFRQ